MGDGIQGVAVTPEGLIWTSYFDEGVFGNFGWSDPLGCNGLVAWRQDGTAAYAYEPPDGIERVCDCYAMNADGNDIWICYDYDFPLVQIRNGQVEAHWQIPVHGADAFAISGNQALFRGGYGNQDCYHLLNLADPLAVEKSRFQLRDRQGEPIKAQRVAGRGDTLFLIRERDIFNLTVDDAKQLCR